MLNSHKYAVLTAMLSAAGLLPMSAMANISFTEGGERLINTLYTHLYSPSSGLSSSDEIKLAAVCFINDTSACSGEAFDNTENNGGSGSGGAPDYDLNDAERCRKEGYTLTSCAAGETPEGFCIYNSTYFSRCVCPASYKTCEPPYYGVGTACGDKYASCEEDTERACKELDSEFTDTCQTGWKVDPNNACEYDKTFGKCCNLCEGYDYTTIPEGYIADGVACVDCNGTSKYKIKINPCDGFQDCGVMGGDTGAKTCMSGSQIKYDNCKPCPNLGTLSSCPSPFKCTYEECSNSYYKSGCQSGYTWNASKKTCTAQCASTYQYTCTGTGYSGGSGTACGGFYEKCLCSDGYFWNGSTCSDDNPCLKGLVLNFGDVLYSDMSHSYFSVASEIKHGKTPIGVVVCSYSNGGGQAIALNSIQNGQKIQFMAKYSGMPSQDGGTFTTPYRDVSSCRNSDKLMQARDKSYYPAVWAAAEYSTEGTKPGDWCLPAAGVLNAYFTRYSSNTSGFRALEAYGWQSSQLTTDNIVWTSTIQDDVYSPGSVLISYPQEGRYYSEYNNAYLGSQYVGPSYTNEVRPVIEFCTLGYRYDRKTYSCVDCGNAYKYSCRGLHEVGDVNKSCGGEYSECGCENGYKWNGNSCEEE